MTVNEPLNITLLQGYVENIGQEVLVQMITMYEQQSMLYLQRITQSIDEKSQDEWQESCHKMKGAAGSAGLLSVFQKLVSMEKMEVETALSTVQLEELTKLNKHGIILFKQWLDEN